MTDSSFAALTAIRSPRGHLRSALEEAVRAHLDELRTEAEAQHKAGAHELNLQEPGPALDVRCRQQR